MMDIQPNHFTVNYISPEKKTFRVSGEFTVENTSTKDADYREYRKGFVEYSIVDTETDKVMVNRGNVSLKITGDVWSIGTFENGVWIHLASEPFYTILSEVKHQYLSQVK